MTMSKIYIVSGPSGSGKGTLLAELKKRDDVFYSVSATTRDMRPGEIDGVDYHFITREQFLEMLDRDEFLEHAEYQNNFYGTPTQPIKDNLALGKDVIVEIEVQGFLQLKEKLPEAETIFIMPPSVEELERRLRGRGTETEEVIRGRLETAMKEMEYAGQYDHVVVNDCIIRAVRELLSIMGKNEGSNLL
ncbi:MAG: guanylate kinase [Oscillospiraceae bacterium]|nr:guanylate kinase [Oscillospiraceae bacterium]